MPVRPPIDARLLAAEIEASVAEFNRLCTLASTLQVRVVAELRSQAKGDQPERPILAVQVVAPF